MQKLTPIELRRLRLKNDYLELCNMVGDILQFEVIKGEVPYVEEYKLTINIRTIIGPAPTYRDKHEVIVTLPPTYPYAFPQNKMITVPHPYHPNWSSSMCPGAVKHDIYQGDNLQESLCEHIHRIMKTLQFSPEFTNWHNGYNVVDKFFIYCMENGLAPCDIQTLPDPTQAKLEKAKAFQIKENKQPKTFKIEEKKKFDIH
ncbi:MAG: hypothetical protein ACKVTZ_05825 [Bacteroidia bacterium]